MCSYIWVGCGGVSMRCVLGVVERRPGDPQAVPKEASRRLDFFLPLSFTSAAKSGGWDIPSATIVKS